MTVENVDSTFLTAAETMKMKGIKYELLSLYSLHLWEYKANVELDVDCSIRVLCTIFPKKWFVLYSCAS